MGAWIGTHVGFSIGVLFLLLIGLLALAGACHGSLGIGNIHAEVGWGK